MKKYILLTLATFGIIVSCTKSSDFKPSKETEFVIKKNSFRAKTINSKNDKWGEFKQILYYSNDMLDSVWCLNTAGDTVGGIKVSHAANSRTYSAYDLIPSIDQDSIKKIDDSLKLKLGEGKYHLFWVLPKVARKTQAQYLSLYNDGRVKKQVVKSYRPRADVGTGDKFNNTYVLLKTETNIYEYDSNGNIVVNRITCDIHDEKDEKIFKRSLYKQEYNYITGKITGIEMFEAKSGENYSSNELLMFEYLNKQINSVKGKTLQKSFSYSGNIVTINEGNKATTCQLDNNGNVVKISDAKGYVTSIEYEAGHGDIEIYTPLLERLLGTPFIK